MNNRSREIEVKYRVEGFDLAGFWEVVKSFGWLDVERTLETCVTRDIYFPPPKGVDIVRLRDSYGVDHDGFSKQLKELTLKVKDMGGNFNRLEENVRLFESASAFRALILAFGEPLCVLGKEERVLWTTDGIILSAASIAGEARDILYLEIEGADEELVHYYEHLFTKQFLMEREERSLIEIYGPVIH